MKHLPTLVLTVVVFSGIFIAALFRAQPVNAQQCVYAPNGDISGFECFNYEIPEVMKYGDDDKDPQGFPNNGPNINTPTCKTTNRIPPTDFEDLRPDRIEVGNSFRVCCPDPKQCSAYTVRTAICGSAEEAEIGCSYAPDGRHLTCWGNNYRLCDTSPEFPEPSEGVGEKRSGYLLGGGTFTSDASGGKVYQNTSIVYNNQEYPVNNMKVWFCDDNVPNCGPQSVGGEGESRLWFPHLRLIAALTSIAQGLFNPHPSSLVQNTPNQTGPGTLSNEKLLVSKIERYQGIDDNTDVVNTTTNNSSLKIGAEAPDANDLLSMTEAPYNAPQCVVPSINNPGDDLLGPTVNTRVIYTQKYEYDACPQKPNCIGDGQVASSPNECCSYNPGVEGCHADIEAFSGTGYRCGVLGPRTFDTKGKVAVFVKNPLIEFIYDALIVGESSLYKRFMPQLFSQEFEEIPSAVAYAASARSLNQEGQSVEVSTEGSGQPQFYVPHIGSFKKYWLDDFQKALRPKGGTASSGTGQGQTQCYAPQPFSPELTTAIAQTQAKGGAAAKVQKEVLEAIYSIEGYTAFSLSNYTCSKNPATALGWMQVTDGAYTAVTSANERLQNEEGNCDPIEGKLNRCNPEDAMELAARVLLYKVGKLNTGENLSRADVYPAAYGYYGCYDPDQATTDRGCDNWGPGRMGPAPDYIDGTTNYSEVVCWRAGICTSSSSYPTRPGDSCNLPFPENTDCPK